MSPPRPESSARFKMSAARCGSPAAMSAFACSMGFDGVDFPDMSRKERSRSPNSRDDGNARDRERGACRPAVGERDAVFLDFKHRVRVALLDRALERLPIAHLDAFERRLVEEVRERTHILALKIAADGAGSHEDRDDRG